jgi:hypothetical protein
METLQESKKGVGLRNGANELPGWGIDADPKNDPTYPMKHNTGADHDRLNYERSAQQPQEVEVLKSIERPTLPRVFGTSTPPSGLSGMLRRYAFKFSEGSSGHWLTLILADRVNVVEGIVDDLKHGHVPNIFAERGWKAEWKYNRKGAVRSIAVGVAITSALVAYFVLKNRDRKSEYVEGYYEG